MASQPALKLLARSSIGRALEYPAPALVSRSRLLEWKRLWAGSIPSKMFIRSVFSIDDTAQLSESFRIFLLVEHFSETGRWKIGRPANFAIMALPPY